MIGRTDLNRKAYWLGEGSSMLSAYSHHIGDGDDPYMLRWILQTPWFSVRVHRILRSDRADALHDHPMDLYSILLSRGYWEVVPKSPTELERSWRRMWSFRKICAEQPHRVELDAPVWTVSIATPRRREWGFYRDRYDAAGFIPHEEFFRMSGGDR